MNVVEIEFDVIKQIALNIENEYENEIKFSVEYSFYKDCYGIQFVFDELVSIKGHIGTDFFFGDFSKTPENYIFLSSL